VEGQNLCLGLCANYSTILKWHLGVPLLPADCAGRPCPLCGGPLDIFGDHAVSCNKSGFGNGHLDNQPFFCVITQARIPHDREVDIARNGRRPVYILLKAWGWMRDLAVDTTIVLPNPTDSGPCAAVPLSSSGTRENKKTGRAPTRVGYLMYRCRVLGTI